MKIQNPWVYHAALLLISIIDLQAAWSTQKASTPYFIIIVPSYNNILWYEKNLTSIFSQNYDNFHLIYIDDYSTDGTSDAVTNYINQGNFLHKVTYIRSDTRKGALFHLYYTIHSCADDDIIVTVDGDDWLAHNQVLSYLAQLYSDQNIWMTFGQFKTFPFNTIGHCRPLAKQSINHNSFRSESCYASHLRTFYAWLFKKINYEDLLHNQEFFPVAWDWAFLYPMLEMAGNRAHFVPDILYIYNQENALSDYKSQTQLQQNISAYIRQKEAYQRL